MRTNHSRSATAWKRPTCIVQPADTLELQKIVRILTTRHVRFAIRSGGHSPSPFAANIDNGILIDLSNFNQMNYNAADSTATVGAGMKWGDVYHRLDAHNVTVVGGRVLDVGVGGLTLGSKSTSSRSISDHSLIFQVACPISRISMDWFATMLSTSR